MQRLIVILLLAAPLPLARAGNFLPHARRAQFINAQPQKQKPETPRPRGHAEGDYDLSVTGHYTGAGTATVGTAVSLNATVHAPGSKTDGTLVATALVITNGYFKGNATVMGIACTIQGRVDLPSAQDDEQTRKQAVTGRITGTFRDANGNVGRIVAVQQIATPDGKAPPHPKGPDANKSGGNGAPPPGTPPHPKASTGSRERHTRRHEK